MRIYSDQYEVLTLAGGANKNSYTIPARNYKTACITVVAANSYNGSLSIFGSQQEAAPDITISSSGDNQYGALQIVDLRDGNFIAGILSSIADGTYLYEVNVNAIAHLIIQAASASVGDVRVFVRFYEDNGN